MEESVRTYGRHRPMRSVAIYGGVGFEPQARALRAGTPIVVATPGRLLDHVQQRTIDLSKVEVLILDEADRMLDMGFIRDIRKVLALLPPRRQNLLFSATFSDEIRQLAAGFMNDPASVDVAPRNQAAELVEQVVMPVDRERKRELLSHLVRSGRITQALVFTRTKHGANRLAEQLGKDGINALAIHGNKSQGQRVRALDDFKSGRAAILVATDIAARGIDIEALPYVVNFELPMVAEDYVHRIGRTGRAGVGGQAVSLVCVDEAELLRDIQRLLRRPLPTRPCRASSRIDRSAPSASPSGPATRAIARRTAEAAAAPPPDRVPVPRARPAGRVPADPVPAPPGPATHRPKPRAATHNGASPVRRSTTDAARPSAPAHGDRRSAPGPRRPTALPGERISRAGTPQPRQPPQPPRRYRFDRGEEPMTKHSPYERAQRAAETERMKQVEAAWYASIPADVAKAFAHEVEAPAPAARSRRGRTWRPARSPTRRGPAASPSRSRTTGARVVEVAS